MTALLDSNKHILNKTLQRTIELLNAESGSLFLFDNEREELVLNTILDKKRNNLVGVRKRLGEGVAGSVATNHQAILVENIKTDPRFNDGSRGNGYNNGSSYLTDSFICVPLVTSFGLIGVMSITDKKSTEIFSQKDFELACLIAKLTSLTMESDVKVKSLEKELQRKDIELKEGRNNAQSQDKFASIGRLSGNIIHEISGPLDGVMRYTNILLEKSDENSIVREYLLEIKNGLARMFTIMRSLMDFCGNFKLKKEDGFIDVNSSIDEEMSLVGNKCFSPAIKIEKIYQKELPLVIDYGLGRLFSNIIRNAFDAMPKAGLLRICTSCDDQNIKIIFSDNGCGMTEDTRRNSFAPFFSTKPKDNGMGLGLSICQEVVKRYSGNIEVQSQLDQGTIVTIIIPKSEDTIKEQ